MNESDPGCGLSPLTILAQLGWTEECALAFPNYISPYEPGRVTCRQKTSWKVITGGGCGIAGISETMRRLCRFPAVGYFVVLHNQPGVNDCGHPPANDRVHARSFGKGRYCPGDRGKHRYGFHCHRRRS